MIIASLGTQSAFASRNCPDGNGCLPGAGYTYDTGIFSCGVITSGTFCYDPGTFSQPNGYYHTYGWGSSDYDGGGTANPQLGGCTTSVCYFGGTSSGNLIRSCYQSNCNDQATYNMQLYVGSGTGNHTIKGHGEA